VSTEFSKVHEKRLLKLADKLETVPRKRFNIGFWWSDSEECGTVGCALGWACTIKSFQNAGLNFETKFGGDPTFKPRGSEAKVCKAACISSHGYDYFNGDYRTLLGARLFFGISAHEANTLFLPSGYPGDKATPKQVARKIRTLVKIKQAAAAKVAA